MGKQGTVSEDSASTHRCIFASAEDDPHDSEQTALLRAALALFENYDLPKGVLEEIRKCVFLHPPQRPAPKKQPKVSRVQEMLNFKKRVHREEQELDQRKTPLELARRAAEGKQQKVMERGKCCQWFEEPTCGTSKGHGQQSHA